MSFINFLNAKCYNSVMLSSTKYEHRCRQHYPVCGFFAEIALLWVIDSVPHPFSLTFRSVMDDEDEKIVPVGTGYCYTTGSYASQGSFTSREYSLALQASQKQPVVIEEPLVSFVYNSLSPSPTSCTSRIIYLLELR